MICSQHFNMIMPHGVSFGTFLVLSRGPGADLGVRRWFPRSAWLVLGFQSWLDKMESRLHSRVLSH